MKIWLWTAIGLWIGGIVALAASLRMGLFIISWWLGFLCEQYWKLSEQYWKLILGLSAIIVSASALVSGVILFIWVLFGG